MGIKTKNAEKFYLLQVLQLELELKLGSGKFQITYIFQ